MSGKTHTPNSAVLHESNAIHLKRSILLAVVYREGVLSFAEAQAAILSLASPIGLETVSLENAIGRVLGQDIIATMALPPFHYSAMDGYAVRANAVEPSRPMPVAAAEATPGATPPPLREGDACRIFTGAPLPEGADAVVMQEEAERHGGEVTFHKSATPRQHVRPRGEDLLPGAVALKKGVVLGPGQLALLAALDFSSAAVYARPRATILSTGNELREPGTEPQPFSVVDSNRIFLSSAIASLGGVVAKTARVRDDLDETVRALDGLEHESDLIVTVGGVSVGDHDHVRTAFASLGYEMVFYKVAMKPGKPVAVAKGKRCIIVALPGNPASASLTFALFGAPLLRAIAGVQRPTVPPELMPVVGDRTRKAGRLEFYRAALETGFDGIQRARLCSNQAAGSVVSFASADTLVMVEAERTAVRSGDVLPALRIGDLLRL